MPTKAAYRTFEENPRIEFEFYLAERLKMTVGTLRDTMANDEFIRWEMYFSRIAQREELERLKAHG